MGFAVSVAMIRPYADGDLEDVLDVWYRASRLAHSFLGYEFFSRERRAIADRWLPMAQTLVYEAEKTVAGFIALIGNEVGAIFVDPEVQRRGIGRALMDRARESRPFLELDVFADNEVGRRFYAAYGFEEIGRHTHEDTGFLVLRLRLDPSTK